MSMLTLAALIVLTPQGGGVPNNVLNRLNRGVNVTRWFCYLANAKDTKHYETYFKQEDIDNLKRLHVNFVRLCVSPEAIYDNGKPNAVTLPYLDKALQTLHQAGMMVFLDLHDNGQLKLDTPDHDNSGLVSFWKSMAEHYRGRALGSTVFEIVNEPVFQKNAPVWWALQQKTVEAIRAIDPKRTIVVSGTGWGGIDGLTEMKPLAQTNLIYSYHCYDPFIFTHQGATWTGPEQQAMKNIPFPSSPEAVAKVIDQIPEQYRGSVRSYGEQRLGKDYLRSRIAKAADWGRANGLSTVLGEFGAYPPVSPPDSRARWFTAMAEIVEDLRAPNAIWGYDDGLGLGRSVAADGSVKLDPVTLRSFYKDK